LMFTITFVPFSSINSLPLSQWLKQKKYFF
jgi:hypothetical protein